MAKAKAVEKEHQSAFERMQAKLHKATGEYLQTAAETAPVEFLSTGVAALDRICNGGLPWGRIIEVYGPYSSGKTLLCQKATVQVQKMDGIPIFVDREHSLDREFAERGGVDSKRLVYEENLKTVEDIFDYVMSKMLEIRKLEPKVYIATMIDSIAAANTRKELARDKKMRDEEGMAAWDKDMGHRAKMIGEALRKLSGIMDRRMMVIIVNQVRSKVGVMFGNPETTTGGQALPFYASLRIRLQQGTLDKYEKKFKIKNQKMVANENGAIIGTRVICNVTKSKVGPPFRKCEIVQSFEFGFLEYPGLYECLLDEGILKLSQREKGKFIFEGKTYAANKFVSWMKEHPQVLTAIPAVIERDETDLEEDGDDAEGAE